jgi:hypothetical protein
VLDESVRDSLSDAPGRAGDECNLSVQRLVERNVHTLDRPSANKNSRSATWDSLAPRILTVGNRVDHLLSFDDDFDGIVDRLDPASL